LFRTTFHNKNNNMRTRTALAALLALAACGADEAPSPSPPAAVAYDWALPPGLPQPKVPDDNPMTAEKVTLGRYLFYDKRLSGNQTYACASCHEQARAFTDGRARALGSTNQEHHLSSMSLTNVAYATTFGWANPRLRSLEDQALIPMLGTDPVELGLAGLEAELLDRLRADPRYQALFPAAFPDDNDPFTLDNVVKAIASFERTLLSGSSPFDRYIYGGEDGALSPGALRGMRIFFSEEVECFHCHGGVNFTDSTTHEGKVFDEVAFHNNGLYNLDGQGAYPPGNQGVYEITGDPLDQGRFKAPSLRNIALTAPYMHDGSIATLEEVIDHYANGGRVTQDGPNAGDGTAHPHKSPFVSGFLLAPQDREDLLAFLLSLTDEAFLNDPRLSDPFVEDQ
jgi:cytochrome c peroxidase